MEFVADEDSRIHPNLRNRRCTALAPRPPPRPPALRALSKRREASPDELQFIGQSFVGMYEGLFLILDILGMGPSQPSECTFSTPDGEITTTVAICGDCGQRTYIPDTDAFNYCPNCGKKVEGEVRRLEVECLYNYCPWNYEKDCLVCPKNIANMGQGATQ